MNILTEFSYQQLSAYNTRPININSILKTNSILITKQAKGFVKKPSA